MVEIVFLHDDVMRCRVILGEVVSFIGSTRAPDNLESSLSDSVTDPMESHCHGFGSTLFDSVSGNACSCTVVCGNGGARGWLLATKFLEGGEDGASIASVVE